MKNTFLSLILLLLTFCTTIDTARAQKITPVAKATEPIVTKNTSNEELTLALVVGVSKYRTIQPNLQFAHQDAIDFANFLVSKVGGRVPEENIVLLKDTMATSSQIYRHLEDLKERALKTKAGKKVRIVLFFSMHGGAFIDPVGKAEKGYLLTYDTDRGFPTQSSIQFERLHQYTQRLLKRENTKVEVYIDACRAGLDITQKKEEAWASELSLKNWDNVLKIVSCSPREYSYESKQWNNGAFTYYLLRGLRGLADDEGNKDEKVSLYELTYFLAKHLEGDLGADNPQMPEKQGYGRLTLAKVDSVTLASIKSNIEIVNIGVFTNKSFVEKSINNMDKEIQRIYKRFTKNLYIGSMDLAVKNYELLAKKITEEKYLPIRGSIKRELIAELMDDSYRILSSYLVCDDRSTALKKINIKDLLKNLNYTLDLIGKHDFRYKSIVSEIKFFESLREIYNNNLGNAEQILTTILTQDTTAIYVYNDLAVLLEIKGYYDKALNILDKGLKIYPNWANLWSSKGIVLHESTRLEESIIAFNRAIALNRNIAESYYNKSVVLVKLEQYKEAIRVLDTAIYLKKDYALAYCNKGFALSKLGEYSKAVCYFDTALIYKQDLIEAYNNKGDCLVRLGRNDEAIIASDSAILINNRFISNYNKESYVGGNLNRYINSKFDSANVKINNGELIMSYNTKGVALINLGRFRESITAFDSVIALKKDFAGAYYAKGFALYNLRFYSDAIKEFDLAIAHKRNDVYVHGYKANAHYLLEHYAEAIATCDVAIALKKDYADGYIVKGYCFSKLNQDTEAIIAYDSAIAIYEKRLFSFAFNEFISDIHNSRGFSLCRLGRYAEAINAFEKSITLNPQQQNPYYNLSCLYSLQNQSKEALSYLEQALQKGYNDFAHIKEDTDLDNIRALPEFSALLKKYQK